MSHYEEVFKCYQTLREMLADRGVVPNALPDLTESEMEVQLLGQQVLEFPVDDTTKAIFFAQAKVKIGDMKKALQNNSHTHCILVFKEKPTVTSMKALTELQNTVHFEIFDMKELSFNISRHTLVPKHERIRDEARVARLLDTYKLKSKTQLPLILRTDPMARYLGLQSGDVVEITRPSPTAGVYKNYRCCV